MRIVPVVLVAMIGVAHADHGDLAGAKDDEKLDGNVLVWLDAPLFLDPLETGPKVTLGGLAGARKDAVGSVVPMHVVGTNGALVEVEPVTTVECGWAYGRTDEDLAKLRLFVRRADLAPVLIKRFDAKLAGGTRITLEPGVAVGRAADGTPIVAFYEDELPAAIPEASIGHAYKSHKVEGVKEISKSKYNLIPGVATLGAQQVTLKRSWGANRYDHRKDLVLFPIQVRCMTAIVAAPKDSVGIAAMMGYGVGLGGTNGMASGTYLPKGTALTTLAGTHIVAVTAGDIHVPRTSDPTVCIDRKVYLEKPVLEAPGLEQAKPPVRTMHLCAPATSLAIDGSGRALP